MRSDSHASRARPRRVFRRDQRRRDQAPLSRPPTALRDCRVPSIRHRSERTPDPDGCVQQDPEPNVVWVPRSRRSLQLSTRAVLTPADDCHQRPLAEHVPPRVAEELAAVHGDESAAELVRLGSGFRRHGRPPEHTPDRRGPALSTG